MYAVSSDYLEAVRQPARLWDLQIKITTPAGEVLNLTTDNVVLGTLTFTDGATCTNAVQVGSTFSNSVEFSLSNKNKVFSEYNFYGSKVEVTVGLWIEHREEYEYVPLGIFYVLENVKKFSTIPITCFDRMSFASKAFDFSSIVFPTTLLALLDAAAAQCDIPVSSELRAEVAALTYEITDFSTTEVSCRDILAGIGLMLAKNLRISRLGVLESFWYSATGTGTTPNTRKLNSEFDDMQVFVTGCYFEDMSGTKHSYGTDQYMVKLPTNPCVQSAEVATEVLVNALTRLRTLVYRPATVQCLGDPALQSGDVLVHQSTSVGNVEQPVMKATYKFRGNSILTSLGISRSSMEQQSTSDRQYRQAVQRVDEATKSILLEVADKYADTETVSRLELLAGQVSIEVGSDQGTLATHITAPTEEEPAKWEAKYFDEVGALRSGFYFDFESRQFRFDGTGQFWSVSRDSYIALEGKEVVLYRKTPGVGYTPTLRLGIAEDAEDGSDHSYILMGYGSAAGGGLSLVKRFNNGIWIGNSYPVADSGIFTPQLNYAGIFVDVWDKKTYVVEKGVMQPIYVGNAVARFA